MMDALLKYTVPWARGFLLLRPIVYAYPHWGALEHVEARVHFSSRWVRRIGGKILPARASS
jgi:hypothetical protein